ncbi:EscU/YscU/HrcU family type III secretion system export apparatus switch protein [Phyllobacterium endophyticum]|uniref:Flagellar biosynthetic protein FlhB n=1 Tax=Phyllobacterium endophyticum TaxID=1149773 RepID=A0A2P7ANY6_9HYPH|nr:EscU/YscU/HrcU family type III secretion system export apparatus switch protein [Phyllobacterium endophyticum]MBB3233734.1 flagellar biosynthetic protein FlhB [Phyllobacterium endophyticum]PSH55923.1 flagellar biosynthesis protein FlhB [Phyllobacterium endophyticum]TYR41066.1 flagellar type III secretion system protein FlhB [Phyllobacterium endophyticum]
MSDAADKDSKTEEATEKKVSDAIEKGNLPFSREAPILASIIAFLIIMVFVVVPSGAKLASFLTELLDKSDDWRLNNADDARELFAIIGGAVGLALLPVLVLVPGAGILASVLQNAPRVVLNRIQPETSRISVAKGWSRLFGSAGRVEFFKSTFKFAAASIIVFMIFFEDSHFFVDAIITEPSQLPELIRAHIVRLLASIAIAVTVLAAFDLAWARIHWRSELRMTRQEIKDEHKQAEGDPLLKSRLRSLGRNRARQRMIASVPTATLIVANPTHFSVALRYNPAQDGAPVVVAKGQDIIALKIREIAEANRIPIFENIPLARALYKQVQVNNVIAPEFYKAVAELIQFVNARRK